MWEDKVRQYDTLDQIPLEACGEPSAFKILITASLLGDLHLQQALEINLAQFFNDRMQIVNLNLIVRIQGMLPAKRDENPFFAWICDAYHWVQMKKNISIFTMLEGVKARNGRLKRETGKGAGWLGTINKCLNNAEGKYKYLRGKD